jgi:hypothetical protein
MQGDELFESRRPRAVFRPNSRPGRMLERHGPGVSSDLSSQKRRAALPPASKVKKKNAARPSASRRQRPEALAHSSRPGLEGKGIRVLRPGHSSPPSPRWIRKMSCLISLRLCDSLLVLVVEDVLGPFSD